MDTHTPEIYAITMRTCAACGLLFGVIAMSEDQPFAPDCCPSCAGVDPDFTLSLRSCRIAGYSIARCPAGAEGESP